jgi:hypothetical protein
MFFSGSTVNGYTVKKFFRQAARTSVLHAAEPWIEETFRSMKR